MKWIKIEHETPHCFDDIIFTDGKEIYVGHLESCEPLEDLGFFNALDSLVEDDKYMWPDNITHWMPLPKPPKDKDED